MPFGLKNAPSKFQNIMNDIFTLFSNFFIDDVLIFSKSIKQYWKHLHTFVRIIINNGLVVSPTKNSLFQNNIRFLVHKMVQNTITLMNRSLQFANKFPDEIKDNNQLQRFLGSLNYISDYYENL
jgi:hypothetical protein